MIINLYGNCINAYNITKLAISPSGDSYLVYMAGGVDSTVSTEPNYIEITKQDIATVDGDEFIELNVVKLKETINKLVALCKFEIQQIVEGLQDGNG